MPIHDKPFSFSEALRKIVFKGRPNFFNAKDFNKELELIHSFIEEFNKIFAVSSDVAVSITSFGETNVGSTVTRTMGLSWAAGNVLYRGVKLPVAAGSVATYSRDYQYAATQPSPANPRPAEYVVLTADLVRLTYADNPVLCGIQADEIIDSAPSVDVDQYQNIQVILTNDPSTVTNAICVLGTIFPTYDVLGTFVEYKYFNNTFNDTANVIKQGKGYVSAQTLGSNKSIFERLSNLFLNRVSNLRNERQLSARFNLADLTNTENARHNIGLSEVLNHRQLVRSENLRDLTNTALARQNLGLKSAATRRVGFGINDVAPGNIFANDMVVIFVGSPAAVPEGWAICNGSNGTRDLRGRFLIGYDASDPQYDAVGKIGGLREVPLTIDNLPAHSHTGTTAEAGEHKHQYELYTKGSRGEAKSDGYWRVNGETETWETMDAGAHVHTMAIDNTGGDKAHENRPPYFVVAFIQYIGGTYDDGYSEVTQPAALVFDNFSDPTETTDGGLTVLETFEANDAAPTVGSGIKVANP